MYGLVSVESAAPGMAFDLHASAPLLWLACAVSGIHSIIATRRAPRWPSHAQGRAAMAGAAKALEMGPKERAMYLRRRLGPEPQGGPEEEASTIAGPTPGALRTWLRQVTLTLKVLYKPH